MWLVGGYTENLPVEDRTHIFYTLDNLIKAAKLKAI